MKYAVFKTGGKQYRAAEGEVLTVERINKTPKSKIEFSEVLLLVDEGERKLGSPLIKGLTVEGEILDHIRGPKISVAKFKSKVRYRKKTGHRQELTRVKIGKVGLSSVKKENPEKLQSPKIASKKAKK